MKRRQLMRYAGAGLIATVGTVATSKFVQAATADSLSVQWLGHTCFLFTGGGKRVLVNPFRSLGCTAGYRLPKVAADFVLISSQLFDEGAAENLPGNPRILFDPGVYQVGAIRFQGISIDHDRQGGRRFGRNVAWQWNQGGINIVHLGGAAAPIALEQKILMGRPDLAFIPVGGGPKAYNPEEAKQAVAILNPKIVIPTQYRTQAADGTCDIVAVDEFLTLMAGTPIRRVNSDAITIRQSDLPQNGSEIMVLSYKF
ncbi:MAG: MBL fold metallo-hydrolase [Coleofasciculaceae cyanobacterium]